MKFFMRIQIGFIKSHKIIFNNLGIFLLSQIKTKKKKGMKSNLINKTWPAFHRISHCKQQGPSTIAENRQKENKNQ